MKKAHYILIFVLALASTPLQGQHEMAPKTSEFEQAVFYEIFPLILDQIHTHKRPSSPPPPPPEYLEERGYKPKRNYKRAYEKWEGSDDYKKRLAEWERRKDSTFVWLAIADSVSYTEENDQAEFLKHFQEVLSDSDSVSLSDGFRIDLSKLKTNQKNLGFIYQSELPEGKLFRQGCRVGKVRALVSFTSIWLDPSKSFGMLNAGYVKAPLNGFGVRIFIKKTENDEWVIDKIVGTWIS